jgi:peptidyl-prolyl cis-trans isomerase C
MLGQHLMAQAHGQALHQFLHVLVEQADIQGVDMTGALEPLRA